jgi:thiamine monophosphate kinase
VRQLRDWKGSMGVEELRVDGLRIYGELCAWCLARAHARSGDRIAIAGYLGSSAAFENALADYADVNEGDHRQLAEAAAAGRVRAQADT